MKERAMAIFIGLVMVFSMAGFALLNIVPQQSNPTPSIPTVVDRFLSGEEKISLLRTGKIIIEDFFEKNCTECFETNAMLEAFASHFSDYLVLEKVVANQTELRIIGRGGKIKELEFNITQDELFDAICEMAILQPKECLLMDV